MWAPGSPGTPTLVSSCRSGIPGFAGRTSCWLRQLLGKEILPTSPFSESAWGGNELQLAQHPQVRWCHLGSPRAARRQLTLGGEGAWGTLMMQKQCLSDAFSDSQSRSLGPQDSLAFTLFFKKQNVYSSPFSTFSLLFHKEKHSHINALNRGKLLRSNFFFSLKRKETYFPSS